MRGLTCVLFLATTVYGQSMLETGAAAAGGSVGGVAGKSVGEGLANIFNKVDQAAGKAAKTGSNPKTASNPNAPLMEVGPGVPKGGSFVPPPPPMRRTAVRKTARALRVPAAAAVAPPVIPPAAPLLEVTTGDLKKVVAGMDRENVLQMGPPAVRITMFDDGHLLEIYRYMENDTTIGVVKLVDGSVESVRTR